MKKRIICLLCGILLIGVTGCNNGKSTNLKDIEQIKTGYLNACPNYSIEELINNYMEAPNWIMEKSDKGYYVYNVTGKAYYNNVKSDILIQFAIDKNDIIIKDFEVNKVSESNLTYLSLVNSMCDNIKNGKSNIGVKEPEEIDTIIEYDYKLMSNNTEYFKNLYSQLKQVLSNKNTNDFDKEYAKLVSKLFVADFYDLDSKYDKDNVGGVQFIYEDYRENFILTASNSMYDTIISYENGYRNQELPSVKNVNINNIEVINKFDDANAYKVTLTIDYEKDLQYPSSCTLYLVHNFDKLEIAEVF